MVLWHSRMLFLLFSVYWIFFFFYFRHVVFMLYYILYCIEGSGFWRLPTWRLPSVRWWRLISRQWRRRRRTSLYITIVWRIENIVKREKYDSNIQKQPVVGTCTCIHARTVRRAGGSWHGLHHAIFSLFFMVNATNGNVQTTFHSYILCTILYIALKSFVSTENSLRFSRRAFRCSHTCLHAFDKTSNRRGAYTC